MRRSTPFADIVKNLTPFFVTRQVICGAGRVGIGADGRGSGFQISQRADFFEVEVGLETTLKRPIINTRDEPHADPEKYRRLHVIIGDANMSEVATYLKMGTTALVLAMIEDKFFPATCRSRRRSPTCARSPTTRRCKYLVTLRDGRKMTAVQLQTEYLELARKYTEDKYGTDVDPMTKPTCSPAGSRCSPGWPTTRCSCPASWTGSPSSSCSRATAQRDGLAWDAPKLQLFDLQYSDVRQERGPVQPARRARPDGAG